MGSCSLLIRTGRHINILFSRARRLLHIGLLYTRVRHALWQTTSRRLQQLPRDALALAVNKTSSPLRRR
jgi:hypothetical protein